MIKKGLAVAVILLFIGMCVVPSTAIKELREKSSPINFDGSTLYVDGTGSGIYTNLDIVITNIDADTLMTGRKKK